MRVNWETVRRSVKQSRLATIRIPQEELEVYSEFFDPEHYRKAAGLPEIGDIEALNHYLTIGWSKGLDPSPDFSTNGYLQANPDVLQAEANPLQHYVHFGRHEARDAKLSPQCSGLIDELSLERISGWCVNENDRGEILEISILIDGVVYTTLKTDFPRLDLFEKGISNGKGGYDTAIPIRFLEAGEHTVTMQMPDGTSVSKEITVPERPHLPRPQLSADQLEKLKIVVPVYNAAEDVEICIARLKAFTPKEVEIILIDDCSPDSKIAKILKTVEEDPRFRVLKNSENIGFTKTVNRGLVEAEDADVIILNSDARVTPRWAEGLCAAAYSRPKVATVTAMSDRAGAFSAPNIGNENPLPPGIDEITYAQAFRRRSLRLYPEVPTGNGFCMYIRRAAMKVIGTLDANAFPRGYGEENDFCMRALRAGWVNVIDDATYVFHERTKSFGAAKSENVAAGRKVIDQRYPDYGHLIRCFHEAVSIQLARFRARQALYDCSTGQGILPRALFVTATQSGGTPQTNADLMSALAESFETWVMRCDSRIIELSYYKDGAVKVMRRHVLTEAIQPSLHRSSEYDMVVAAWLNDLGPDIVHIRHLAWHSLSLPTVAKKSGARVIYSLHDFYTVCPSLKLLDEKNVFCDGNCTTSNGDCRSELWAPDSLPPLKDAWVYQWRENMAKNLTPCDGFITTSDSSRERVLRHMPSIPSERFHVIPHGRDFPRFEHLQNFPNSSEPVRILIPGNIDEAKGLALIVEILRLDKNRSLEFHILGDVDVSRIKGKVSRLYLHGRYRREDFAHKVRVIAPHFGAVLSIWDETYCHTLTEMWSVGLPVAVLDFPTLRRRVEDSSAGWALSERAPEEIYKRLLEIATNREELMAKGTAVIRWQARRGAGQSRRQMAARYLDVYRNGKAESEVPKIAVVCPATNGLKKANASTEIRVWERTRNRLDRPVSYIRMDVDGLLANIRMGTIAGAIIQRTAIPALQIDAVVEAAQSAGIPYIFELDDHLMKVPADKDGDGFYTSYAPHLEKLLRKAAVVTVSTDTLAKEMRSYNPDVRVVPNKISGRLWGGVTLSAKKQAHRLLYMGSKTHGEDLQFVLPAIEQARSKYPGLRLTLIGGTSNDVLPDWVDAIEIPVAEKSYSQFVPWLRTQTTDVDLAIAPLMETDFNRFKSGLKVLDYAALGLPVLASRVHCYQSLLGNCTPTGVTLVKNSEVAWTSEIQSKLQDRRKLDKQGQALREWVFENHMLEPSLNEFDALVCEVIEG